MKGYSFNGKTMVFKTIFEGSNPSTSSRDLNGRAAILHIKGYINYW